MGAARVLVIEDNPILRVTIARALARWGYEVLETPDSRECLRLWRSIRPDVVITDLHMPDKDGIEVILEILGQAPEALIIAMGEAGTPELDLLRDARLLGAIATLAKPFDQFQLRACVQEALDAARRHLRTA